MYTTMKEYFKAKDIDLDKLPYVCKSTQGFHEWIVFKNGIMGRLTKGNRDSERCVWFPKEAKYVNKVLGKVIFSPAHAKNLSVENNNCNTLIFEYFGDITLMWTIPVPEKIVNHLHEGLESTYQSAQFVGFSTIINLVNIGHQSYLNEAGTYPTLTSVNLPSVAFRARMEDDYQHIEACLGNEFLRLLTNGLHYQFIGFDDNAHYYRNDQQEIIRFSFYKSENVDSVKEKLSLTSKKIIDDCESTRL